MHNLNAFSSTFLAVCLGLTAILLAGTLFLGVAGKTFAAPKAEGFNLNLPPSELPATASIGTYQMQLSQSLDNEGTTLARVLVWNTVNGKSRYYRFNNGVGAWEVHPVQVNTVGDF